VAALQPEGLVKQVLLRYEAILRETALHRLRIPTRIECFGAHSDVVSMLRDETGQLTRAAIAHRFLLEYIVARPPQGMRRFTRERYDELLAIASRIAEFGRLSDVAHFELADVNARVLASGRLGLNPVTLDRGLQSWLDHALPAQIKEAQEGFASHWATPQSGEGPPEEVEAAFLAEFGVTLTDFGGLIAELVNICTEESVSVVSMPRDAVISELETRLGWKREALDSALVSLTLTPRPDFLTPVGFTRDDVYPWRFNRRLSVLRRPLAAAGADENRVVSWGRQGVLAAASYTASLVFSGRLKASSRAMQALISRLSSEAGLAHQREAAGIASSIGMMVRERVTKVAGTRLMDAHGDLGDVDVLAADPQRFLVWAIECKNLGVARTPWELRHELDDLHDPDGGIVARHQRRVAWLRAHLNGVIGWLSLPSGPWRVEGLIVVSAELVGPHVRQTAIPVVDIAALDAKLRSAKPSSSASQVGTGVRRKAKRKAWGRRRR
jgi:hypothetical protein